MSNSRDSDIYMATCEFISAMGVEQKGRLGTRAEVIAAIAIKQGNRHKRWEFL